MKHNDLEAERKFEMFHSIRKKCFAFQGFFFFLSEMLYAFTIALVLALCADYMLKESETFFSNRMKNVKFPFCL
jgi:hypothetical protein